MVRLHGFIRRYTSISAVIDILSRKELPLLNPEAWDDRNDSYFMGLYKEKLNLGGLYGICAAQCSETYHHWRIFTGKDDGACLEIKRAPLEAGLVAISGVRFGEVDYLLLRDVESLTNADMMRLPFLKREGFTDEAEYRIIAETTAPQRPAMSIDLPIAWINRIHLNPWLPKSIAKSVRATLKRLPGCSHLKIPQSELTDSERWQRAGDKVVGKKSLPALKLT